jgi:predicted aldo/keto reductase-like oxidoreductase
MEENNNFFLNINIMFDALSIYDYDLTQKQNYCFQQWRERQRKCEEKKRKKDAFMIVSMKPTSGMDLLRKEQNYFDKWIQEQEIKGEVFKIKSKPKSILQPYKRR